MKTKGKNLAVPVAYALAIVTFFWVRYGIAPVSDFVVDDWSILERSCGMSWSVLWRTGLLDVFRPFYVASMWSAFKLFGDHIAAFRMAEVLIMLFLLGSLILVARRIANDLVALIAIVIVAILPNISQPFYFHAHSILLYIPALYLLTIYFWITYLDTHRIRFVFCSFGCFFVALYSYEYGIALPVALLVFAWPKMKNDRRLVSLGAVYFAISLSYLLWRYTEGFGLANYAVADPSYFASDPIGLKDLLFNIRNIGSWWFGKHLWTSLVNGWQEYQIMKPKWQYLACLSSILVVLLLINCCKRLPLYQKGYDRSRMLFSLMACFALTYLPFILFPASSRHNLFPGLVVAILLGILLENSVRHLKGRRILAAAILVGILGMSSQGTSLAWMQMGALHRGIFDYLKANRVPISHSSVVLFNTQLLREKTTLGLLAPINAHTDTWAKYRNALSPRGFSYQSMLNMLYGRDMPVPYAVLDVECGALWNGDQLLWHARFRPDEEYLMERAMVYEVDCLNVVRGTNTTEVNTDVWEMM